MTIRNRITNTVTKKQGDGVGKKTSEGNHWIIIKNKTRNTTP